MRWRRPKPGTLAYYEWVARDPWHNRVSTAVADWWRCRILGRHYEKMDSRGYCCRCPKRLRP